MDEAIDIARGLASRLRLKLKNAFPTRYKVRYRQGIGFSPEIETMNNIYQGLTFLCIARGLASRLRLKLLLRSLERKIFMNRQGIGFSPEIETIKIETRVCFVQHRQGIGFSPEIETYLVAAKPADIFASPGDWLLA